MAHARRSDAAEALVSRSSSSGTVQPIVVTVPGVPVPKGRTPGRPKKPEIIEAPCERPFDEVARGVVAAFNCKVNEKSIWQASKELAGSIVRRDRSLRPCAKDVFGFLLDHVNREQGCDWHGIDSISEELAITPRAVQNGFQQLSKAGYILREYNDKKEWRTTLPCLVSAADQIRQQRMAKDTNKNPGRTRTKTQEGHEQKPRKDTNKNARGHEQKCVEDTNNCSSKYLEGIPRRTPLPLNPPRSQARKGDGASEIKDLLEEIKTPDREHVVERLFAPMLAELPLVAPDPGRALVSIADEYGQLSARVLDTCLANILDERKVNVKPADIRKHLKAAEGSDIIRQRDALKRKILSTTTEADLGQLKCEELDPLRGTRFDPYLADLDKATEEQRWEIKRR